MVHNKNPGSLKEEMVHCFDRNSCSIHAFDIDSERFNEFRVSSLRGDSHRHFDQMGLRVLGGCLSLTESRKIDRDVTGIWVMKDYGNKES